MNALIYLVVAYSGLILWGLFVAYVGTFNYGAAFFLCYVFPIGGVIIYEYSKWLRSTRR